MKFARSIARTLIATLAIAPAFAVAQDIGDAPSKRSPMTVFAAVPTDAWAVLAVPSLAQLDQKMVALSQQLQLPMMGPPLGMAKMMLGIMAGIDDNGGLALALLPTDDLSAAGKSVIVFVPVTSFDELVAPMSPQPADNGLTKIHFMEKETYAAPFGKFAALAQTPETLAKAMNARQSLRDTLTEDRIDRLNKDDITFWINLGAFTETETFAQYAMMLQMLSLDAEMFKQFNTGALSLRFGDAGINIGTYIDADPTSDMGKTMAATKGTDKSMLVGLPDGPFILATGSVTTEAAGKQGAEMFGKVMALLSQQAGEQTELFDGLARMAANLMTHLRHTAVSLSPLPAESDGMIAFAAVITTDDAGKRVLDTVKSGVASIKEALAANAEAAEYTRLIEHHSAAERIGDHSADHLRITLPFEAGSDELAKADKILGKEGVLFRIANIDGNRVAVTLGGGPDRLAKVIDTVKSKKSPLADAKGIQHVAPHLPKSRNSELYLAVDRIFKLIAAVGEAVGDPLPIPAAAIPDVSAPLSIVSAPAGPAGTQQEIFIPMPLLQAAKNVAMAQMMAPPPPRQVPAAPQADPSMD